MAQTNCSIFSKLDSLPILKGKSYLKLILKLQNNSYANNFGLTSTYIIKILKIPRSNLVVNFQLHPTISSLYIFLFSKSRDANLLFNFFSLANFTPRPQIHLASETTDLPPVPRKGATTVREQEQILKILLRRKLKRRVVLFDILFRNAVPEGIIPSVHFVYAFSRNLRFCFYFRGMIGAVFCRKMTANNKIYFKQSIGICA